MKTKFYKYCAGFFILATLSVIAACGSKGNNDPQPVAPIYTYPNCLNCQNVNGSIFFSGESADYTGNLRATWSFAGQNMTVQPYPYNTGMTSETYQGLVSTTGQLNLSQSMNLGYCMIPAGSYSLVTYQAGQWSYGIVSNLNLQAIGPGGTISMMFYGQVSASSYLTNGQLSTISASVGRMYGNLQVQSINGQPCNQIIGVR